MMIYIIILLAFNYTSDFAGVKHDYLSDRCHIFIFRILTTNCLRIAPVVLIIFLFSSLIAFIVFQWFINIFIGNYSHRLFSSKITAIFIAFGGGWNNVLSTVWVAGGGWGWVFPVARGLALPLPRPRGLNSPILVMPLMRLRNAKSKCRCHPLLTTCLFLLWNFQASGSFSLHWFFAKTTRIM